MVVHVYNPSIGRKVAVQARLGKNTKPYLKNSQSEAGLGIWLKW
jgi:hypothetical protein